MRLAKKRTPFLALTLAISASVASAIPSNPFDVTTRVITHVDESALDSTPRFALHLERSFDVCRFELCSPESRVRGFDFTFEAQPQANPWFEPEIAVGDGKTGLLYARNRWIDPELGRFISSDPLGYVDGPSMYAFGFNDPVNSSDPLGLSGDWAIETRAAKADEAEARRQREYEVWCRGNPKDCEKRENRNAGVARAVGGALQCVAGGAAMSTPTGAGQVSGAAAIGRCVDNVVTGVKQAWTGEEQATLLNYGLSSSLEAIGATPREAGVLSGVLEFLADLGSARAAPTAGPSAQLGRAAYSGEAWEAYLIERYGAENVQRKLVTITFKRPQRNAGEFLSHLKEQEAVLNAIDRDVLSLNLSAYATNSEIGRRAAQEFGVHLPNHAAHGLDVIAGGPPKLIIGPRLGTANSGIGAQWRLRRSQIVPGEVHRLEAE